MILDYLPGTVDLAYLGTILLLQLQQGGIGSRDLIEATLLNFTGLSWQVGPVIEGEHLPIATLQCDSGNYHVFLILGNPDFATGQLIVDGYNTSRAQRGDSGANPQFVSAAENLTILLQPGPFAQGDIVQIFGHSYGGAVAYALANIMVSHSPRLVPRITTYGAPRFADYSFNPFFAQMVAARFFNEDDPVPFLPPHNNEDGVLNSVFPIGITSLYQSFCHWGEGSLIGNNAVIAAADNPPIGTFPASLNLVGWATQWMTAPSLGHRLSQYFQRLQALSRLMPWNPTNDNVGNHSAAAHAPANADVVASRLGALSGGQGAPAPTTNAETRVEPSTALTSSSLLPALKLVRPTFYAGRVGKNHYVFNDGNILMQVGGGKLARRIASTLNRLQANWIASKARDLPALESAIESNFPE